MQTFSSGKPLGLGGKCKQRENHGASTAVKVCKTKGERDSIKSRKDSIGVFSQLCMEMDSHLWMEEVRLYPYKSLICLDGGLSPKDGRRDRKGEQREHLYFRLPSFKTRT